MFRILDKGAGLASNSSISPDGTLVLGQEQDIRSGGFSNAESYVGLLYGVELWDSIIDADVLSSLTLSCVSANSGNVLTWADFKHGLRGSIRVQESPFCRKCPAPFSPPHGSVRLENDTALYTCEKGYVLSDPDSASRPCLVYGGWSGYDPECARISCGYPGYIENGMVQGNVFSYGDSVTYQCTRGFKLAGSSSRVCQHDGLWSAEAPECLPVTCEAPQEPVNGSMSRITTDNDTLELMEATYALGQQVTFQCNSGFRLDGPSILTCLDDGQWEDVIPVCQSLACTQPPYVEHGIITNGVTEVLPEELSAFLTPGSILTFACTFGYQLESTGSVTCSDDGLWIGNNPKCVPIKCGIPQSIPNGYVQYQVH